jgi:hypothetical protein
MLKLENNIAWLIYFLREFLTRLTMIKSHAESTFYTIFSLLIRVLTSHYLGLSACIVSWTQALEAIMNESRIYQPAQAVWIFHQVVPSLILRTVSIVHRFHRAFEAFDDSDRNLAQFVELRIFTRCDQFLVPRSRDIEPRLAWLDIQRPWPARVARVPSPFGYSGFSQIKKGLVFVGHTAHSLTLELVNPWDVEVPNAEWVMCSS